MAGRTITTRVLPARRHWAWAAPLALLALPGTPAGAQANPATGTRQPVSCAPSRARPASPAQIAHLIQCARESSARSGVTILENITVQAGATRPYNYYADHGFYSIDTTSPVLPIRGSIDRYVCAPIEHKVAGDTYSRDTAGKNCMVIHERRAAGACFHSTFGDWQCTMMEAVHPDEWLSNQPPPRR